MKKKFLSELSRFGELQEQTEAELDVEMDQWWEALSKEDQMNAFYSVVKRLSKAEMEDATYRHILYDVFEFSAESEAYQLGMLCGLMKLHNMIKPDGDVYLKALDQMFGTGVGSNARSMWSEVADKNIDPPRPTPEMRSKWGF